MNPRSNSNDVPGSFRDPSGFLFHRNGTLYRQVNLCYKNHYDLLINSGLYEKLSRSGLLIPHQEAAVEPPLPDKVYKIIRPDVVDFISYPYEWCFSQLKDAALLTLRIQKLAVEHGMSLKDASAYNVQFRNGKPILIDTLSFEKREEGRPWVAYRQFCQHFLAPLALMSYRDVRLSQLLRVYIDGVPLDLASVLLPARTRLNLSLLTHIHLQAKAQKHYAGKTADTTGRKMSRMGFLGILDHLESAVRKLAWKAGGTEWGEYYEDTNYSQAAFAHKAQLVGEFLDRIRPNTVWDLGANRGVFSRIAGGKGIRTLSFDMDPAAVEKNYHDAAKSGETNILPLVLDLTNPSPGIGWQNDERLSFIERGPADAVLALALIHHLAISNNVPLPKIADFFARVCRWLVIEFVPKSDSNTQRLLATREDVFPDYRQEAFEREFAERFVIHAAHKISESERTLYLMELRQNAP